MRRPVAPVAGGVGGAKLCKSVAVQRDCWSRDGSQTCLKMNNSMMSMKPMACRGGAVEAGPVSDGVNAASPLHPWPALCVFDRAIPARAPPGMLPLLP